MPISPPPPDLKEGSVSPCELMCKFDEYACWFHSVAESMHARVMTDQINACWSTVTHVQAKHVHACMND